MMLSAPTALGLNGTGELDKAPADTSEEKVEGEVVLSPEQWDGDIGLCAMSSS